MHNGSTPTIKRDVISAAGIVGAALLVWEAVVRLKHTPVYILPPPSTVAGKLWQNAGYLLDAAWVTFGEALGGLLLGLTVGIAVAALITFWTNLERGVLALSILVKATPMVAIAPLLMIWFGFGPLPKVIITALLTFFPVLINVHSGLHAVDDAALALFHSLHAGRWEVFYHIRWPSALPYLFAALKVVAPLAVTGAVVAEWAGASAGLGRAMWLAYTNLNLPMLFAAIFCSALMSVGLYAGVVMLEKRVVFWRWNGESSLSAD
ncbi:MAG TPA: ABC transporter permease [Anaerolineae bacterium]|nr:ABC transporter permease [Anaerolineae bacterium]HQK14601.1 ABC transporter permease [Anaerolineae bacterium]